MPPRALFVTDLDGTLVSFETSSLPDANRLAIERATNAGVAVAIATGRRRGSFRKDRHRLHGLDYRVSLSNGSVLLAPDNDTPAIIHAFEWAGALELARTPGEGVHGLLAIAAPDDADHDCYVFRPGGAVFVAPAPWDTATHRETSVEVPTARRLVHAALHVASRELAESLEPAARAIFAGASVEIHSVRSPGGGGALLEVVVAGGKGRAVRDLAEALGVPAHRIGAIGDDMNDARLLEAASHRYAVGGSILAKRIGAGGMASATEVRTCEEGAVADALSRFMDEL